MYNTLHGNTRVGRGKWKGGKRDEVLGGKCIIGRG